jgi:hypothetical protein
LWQFGQNDVLQQYLNGQKKQPDLCCYSVAPCSAADSKCIDCRALGRRACLTLCLHHLPVSVHKFNFLGFHPAV